MPNRRAHLTHWIETGAIDSDQIRVALSAARVTPDAADWRRFLDYFLLFLGGLALACAVVFFIAYNWDALGRFGKFALVQLLLLASIAGACWLWLRRLGEPILVKVFLLVAVILLGVLLALIGQSYQTGADPWQLFAAWALLALPWVLMGRFAPLWLLWIGLVNLSVAQYFLTFRGMFWFAFGPADGLIWIVLIINTCAWGLWELAARRHEWLNDNNWSQGALGRWGVRLIAVASGTAITMLSLRTIFEPDHPLPALAVYFLWLAGIHFVYRRRLPDLFMLAGGVASLIVCITAAAAQLLLPGGDSGGIFLLLCVLVVAQAAGAAIWLRKVHEEHDR